MVTPSLRVALALAAVLSASCNVVAGLDGLKPTLDCLPGATRACYDGPDGTSGVGTCAPGLATCNADGTAFGPCEGQTLPDADPCDTPEDEGCDGAVCTETSASGGGGTGGGGPCVPDCTNKRCGDDGCQGLCGGKAMPDTLFVGGLGQGGAASLPDVRAILVTPGNQSAYVAMEGNRLARVDLCDGAVLASTVAAATGYARLRGLALFGDELVVAGRNSTQPKTGYARMTADALALSTAASINTSFGLDGAQGGDGVLALSMNGGYVGKIDLTNACTCSVPVPGMTTYDGSPGIAFRPDNDSWYFLRVDTTTGANLFVRTCSAICGCAPATDCGADVTVGAPLVSTTQLHDLTWTGSRLFAVGEAAGVPELALVNGSFLGIDTAQTFASVTALSAAASVPGHVFIGGPKSTGHLIRVNEDLTLTDLVESDLTGTVSVTRMAADADGVYAGGIDAAGFGYFVKCTHDLVCGAP